MEAAQRALEQRAERVLGMEIADLTAHGYAVRKKPGKAYWTVRAGKDYVGSIGLVPVSFDDRRTYPVVTALVQQPHGERIHVLYDPRALTF